MKAPVTKQKLAAAGLAAIVALGAGATAVTATLGAADRQADGETTSTTIAPSGSTNTNPTTDSTAAPDNPNDANKADKGDSGVGAGTEPCDSQGWGDRGQMPDGPPGDMRDHDGDADGERDGDYEADDDAEKADDAATQPTAPDGTDQQPRRHRGDDDDIDTDDVDDQTDAANTGGKSDRAFDKDSDESTSAKDDAVRTGQTDPEDHKRGCGPEGMAGIGRSEHAGQGEMPQGQMPDGQMPGRRGGMDQGGTGQGPAVGTGPQNGDGTNNGSTGTGESGTAPAPGMQQRSHSQSSGS